MWQPGLLLDPRQSHLVPYLGRSNHDRHASIVPLASLSDVPHTDRDESTRRSWRTVAGTWGPLGNERLTNSTGLVLLVLLAVETLTTLALDSFLNVHIFLGLLLIPPVVLKLASTG